jgi:PRTRC genetic system protein E
MLVTSLLPLLARYSLGFDLVAGPDETVTLTIIPRKADPKSAALESSETRPISITASAAEIDAELARGSDGALGRPDRRAAAGGRGCQGRRRGSREGKGCQGCGEQAPGADHSAENPDADQPADRRQGG